MPINILITGAAGFLGGRTAKYFGSLTEKYKVTATSRRSSRKQELEENNCVFISGDLLNKNHCDELTRGIDTIIHCAALSSPWGNYDEFYTSNVIATKNLLEAAINNDVKKFIFISTPNIYFTYRNRLSIKESEPLPDKMVNHYAATKLIAEQMVLKQNNNKIKTIALRPRGIIGAEDTVIFPRLIRAYHSGKLKIIGNGKNIVDLTCVRNVIAAIECCILANDDAMGKAYNICDGKPVVLWDKINELLIALGMKPVTEKVPAALVLMIASLIEKKHKILRKPGEPEITKQGIATLSISMTVDISIAKQFLNYAPVQSTEEGIKEFMEWYKQDENKTQSTSHKGSPPLFSRGGAGGEVSQINQ